MNIFRMHPKKNPAFAGFSLDFIKPVFQALSFDFTTDIASMYASGCRYLEPESSPASTSVSRRNTVFWTCVPERIELDLDPVVSRIEFA